jgi:hypothetical protein
MAYLNPDPIRTVGHLLGCDSGWPDSLRFAVDARLPVLAKANLDVIVTRLRGDDELSPNFGDGLKDQAAA